MSDDDFSTVQVAADQLRTIVEWVERLEEERREVAEQIKEVYAEAKGNGFDVKTLRKIVSARKKDPNERSEEEAMLDLYMHALGMTPGDFDGEGLPRAKPKKAARSTTPPRPGAHRKRKPRRMESGFKSGPPPGGW